MDLRGIQYFVRIADLGSFSRAAVHLHVAQPALSRHIQRLEGELGVELFSRVSRGVRLTDAGQQLYERAQRLLSELERTRGEIRAMAGAPLGKVVLGVPPTLCPVLIPRVLGRLRENQPCVELKVVGANTFELQDWLMNATIDCAVLTDIATPRHITHEFLAEEDFVLLACPKVAGDAKVSGEALAQIPLTMSDGLLRILEPMLERSGVRLTVETVLNSTETIRILVQQGLASTLLPYSLVRKDCDGGLAAACPLVDPILTRKLIFGTAAGRRPSRAVHEVKRVVTALMRELDSEGAFRMGDPYEVEVNGTRALSDIHRSNNAGARELTSRFD